MMASFSLVTILWSMIAAGAALLGLVHLTRWLLDREAREDLAFSLAAFSFVGVAIGEVGSMQARDAAEWGLWVRWTHLPLFGLVAGLVAFVHFHLGTGRRWLMWSVIGLRALILAVNFASQPNVNFREIASVDRIAFLGEAVSVVGESAPWRWQFLGTLASLLLLVYVLDAAITCWRTGKFDERRAASLIGGSVVVMVLFAGTYSQLVIYGALQSPFLITPAFVAPLLAMSFELGIDMLRAARLARELHDSQRRLELAADSARLGLWEWDGRRGRVFATRQAREMFGLQEGESGDFRRWLEKVDPDDAPILMREMTRAIETGDEFTMEFWIRPEESATRLISARGRAEQPGTGRPTLLRGVLRDITDNRRAENEAHQLRRELAHAGRVSLLGQLSSSLAHELSQPLGAILRNAEAAEMLLASESPDYEELKAIVTDILRDDRRARQVIDRLRTMLKRREAEFQPIAADALMEDVLDLVRADATSRGIRLEHVPAPGLPPVSGDRVQLSQVLLNLILNAMDAVAAQSGGPKAIVLWSGLAADGAVELCVTDSGAGIPPELARKIFEPFYTTKFAGMGIGLAISRSIAEAHGGSLEAQNNERGGATFRLKLPARKEAA